MTKTERQDIALRLLQLVEERIIKEAEIYGDYNMSPSRRTDAMMYATTLQGILIAAENPTKKEKSK